MGFEWQDWPARKYPNSTDATDSSAISVPHRAPQQIKDPQGTYSTGKNSALMQMKY